MASKYQKGQKIIVAPVKNQDLSSRNLDLETYAGQNGEIIDYNWISLDRGSQIFYVYTVEIANSQKELVLHEDELKLL
ncbi:hypothetical protein ACFLWH_00710 [Chloroflexota bacterium]